MKWTTIAAVAGGALLVLRKPKIQRGRVTYITNRRGPKRVAGYLATLSRRAGVPIEITSWPRSPEAQAAAMLAKVERGEDLMALYQNKAAIRALLNTPQTVSAWAQVIDAWTQAGQPLSRHLDGYGTDIRTRNLSALQIGRLIDVSRAMGGRPTLESDHLHIGWPRP